MNIRSSGAGLLALVGTLVLSLGGCEKKEVTPAPKPTPEKAPATPEPDAVYVVRGKVVELPDPANPTKDFRVHHEAIPTFKTPEGKVVGMGEMVMPFPVHDAKLLEGIAVGDIVEITFADWYKPLRKYEVTKLTKLSAETALNLKSP
jgi:hypothetical protein